MRMSRLRAYPQNGFYKTSLARFPFAHWPLRFHGLPRCYPWGESIQVFCGSLVLLAASSCLDTMAVFMAIFACETAVLQSVNARTPGRTRLVIYRPKDRRARFCGVRW